MGRRLPALADAAARRGGARSAAWLLPLLVVLLVARSAIGLEPPRATTIHGRVLDAQNERPLAGASVELHIAGRGSWSTSTADDGAYGFTTELADDDWVVVEASADGFFSVSVGQHGVDLRFSSILVFRLQPRIESTVRGLVFDASRGVAAGISGAQVQYDNHDERQTTMTDAQGGFALLLALPEDNALLPVWVSANGFKPTLEVFEVADLRGGSTIEIGLQPAPPRVDTTIAGIVYNAADGTDAPIAGATIEYVYSSGEDAFPDIHGSLQSGADGRFAFELPLGPHDYVDMTVAAPGFANLHSTQYASQMSTGAPIDLGLAPVGGQVEISPANLSLECSSTFEVSIRNTGALGDTLVILDVLLHLHYGEGVYGTEFSWDLSQVEFPALLDAGEQITFPVTFQAGGRFPSGLTVIVISGARGGTVSAFYFGHNAGCHADCVGDCDRDGVVSIDELVRGVNIGFGDLAAAQACTAADPNSDFTVSIDELVAAVRHALEGCPPDPATPTPTPAATRTPSPIPT
jgi:hypothetical protein